MVHEALLYDKMPDDRVQCKLCAHRCEIKEGKRGRCRVRENINGDLYTLVYGNLISKNVDPIEKKPLYHFFPGTKAFSIATPGCNFHCEWCQNWQISQMPKEMELPRGLRVSPEEIVDQAVQSRCQTIAFTYSEPTIFFEYCYDIAQLAKDTGLKNIFVTNGFMTSEMLEKIEGYLDAANVDIKAFSDTTYRNLMGGRLDPVLESCRIMKLKGIWVEITTLIVPGINDSDKELEEIASFIYHELGPETPWHISRFFPNYKMNQHLPTPEPILLKIKEMGENIGLHYIYLGNMLSHNETMCKNCGEVLISRSGYTVRNLHLNDEGCCRSCLAVLDGVGITHSYH